MLTAEENKALLDARHQFITSNEVGVKELQDLVEKLIPLSAPERQLWTSHVSALSEAWQKITQENAMIPWPEVRYLFEF